MNRQCGERNDIVDVVREDAFQRGSRLVLQIVKVSSRDHGPGHIGSAHERDDFAFQRDEPAAAVTVAPETTRAEEKIKMRHVPEWAVQTGEREPGFEKRNVESRAVVGDDHVEAFHQFAERIEHGGLFIKVADEVLKHVEFVAGKITETDEEWTDSRAALHAGGFG